MIYDSDVIVYCFSSLKANPRKIVNENEREIFHSALQWLSIHCRVLANLRSPDWPE